jgi:hypothetical protein
MPGWPEWVSFVTAFVRTVLSCRAERRFRMIVSTVMAMFVVVVPLMRVLAAELEPMFIGRYTMDTPTRGKEAPE